MRAGLAQVTTNNNSSVTGPAFKADQDFALSMTATSAAATTGTAKVQYSNDPIGTQPASVTNWVDLASASASLTGGTTVGIQKTEFCCNWLRVVYTPTAGTGSVIIYVKTSGV